MSLHVQGGNIRFDPITGEYLRHGNGCGFWKNCFTCPENPNKCHYGNKPIEHNKFKRENINVFNKRTTNQSINLS